MGWLERIPGMGLLTGGNKKDGDRLGDLERRLGLRLRLPFGARAGVQGPYGARVESGGSIRRAIEFEGDPVLAAGIEGVHLDEFDLHAEARGTVQLIDDKDNLGPPYVRLRGSFTVPGGFSGDGELYVGSQLEPKKQK